MQGPQRLTTSNPQQLGGVRNGIRNQHNTRGQGSKQSNHEGCDCNWIKFFEVEVGGIGLMSI